MATYKGIKGFTVQSLATDPVTITGASGAWASGGSLNTARAAIGSANDGTQAASLAFGGNELPGISNKTEAYDGTNWTVLPTLNTARGATGSFGVQTSAVAVGGFTDANQVLPSTAVESWNGSAWSEITELSTQRINSAGIGASNTSGFVSGGNIRPGSPPGVPSTASALTESWNGSSWTSGGALVTALEDNKAFGVVTSALIAGPSTSQSYNGSSWSTVPATLNTTRTQFGAGGASATSGIIFGGSPAGAVTEIWNGSSWTEVSDLASARRNLNGSGSATSALAFGGQGTPPVFSATEEFNVVTGGTAKNEGQVYYNTTTNLLKLTKTVYGTGTWASGGDLVSGQRRNAFGCGVQTAALVAGGYGNTPGAGNKAYTELYDGTSWSETTDLNTARAFLSGSTNGTTTAAIAVGGTGGLNLTELWNGSNWAELAELNTPRNEDPGGAGISTSALLFGGNDPVTADTESWNGSAWSEVSNLNTARKALAGCGANKESALAFGGSVPARTAKTELWNGSSWTEVTALNQAKQHLGGFGIATSAIAFGGDVPPRTANTESWDGTSWTEVGNLASAQQYSTGAGSTGNKSGIAIGGYPDRDTSEEWTVPESVSNVTVASS